MCARVGQLRITPSLARGSSVREINSANPGFTSQRVVIDFSSPNIAKPFHFGHLKSTILGNFLSNLHQFYGHKVTKLNYVGDWGTQYGLLSLGLDNDHRASSIFNSDSTNRSLLEQLVDIYVEANIRGKDDEDYYKQARQRFELMDSNQGDDQIRRWRMIRDLSLKELYKSYKQLGLKFDAYEYESDYAKASRDLVEQMKARGLVKQKLDISDKEGAAYWVIEVIKNDKVLEVPILKSDGTSLYITRDVTAAITRHSRYNFDKMLYVVGADQERHFHCLREIVKRVVEQEWACNLIHIKMGKVVGMSSRSGNFVLLSKIIDEATERFINSTMNTPTSKVFETNDIEVVGRQLAISNLFVYDLRNKRTRNYQFDWEQVMLPSNRSGLQLQGTYARLCALLERAFDRRGLSVYESTDDIDYGADSLQTKYTKDATELVDCLNELSGQLNVAYDTMDPYPLINHAFKLCRLTNRARRNEFLQVIKESDERKARSRLTLFDSSREQLDFIIKLIGLKPLKKI